MRTIFIGDIHGCFEEFLSLLEKVDYNAKEDRLISVGDLINKGPMPEKVLSWFYYHPTAIALLGNHELSLMKTLKAGSVPYKESLRLLDKLNISNDALLHWLESMPSALEDKDWIACHAGLDPWKTDIKDNKRDTLCLSRYWNVDDRSMQTKLARDGIPRNLVPWMHLIDNQSYSGKKIIYGHWAQKGLYRKGRFWGLDTGCCYGGQLTALILPEWQIVQTKSRQKKMFNY